jgi:hypothetical protein
MLIPRKTIALAAIVFSIVCSWGFPRSPLQDNKGQAELPSDLKGVKVYHLPEKSEGKMKGNLAVMRSVAYRDINMDHLGLNLFVRMNPVDRPAAVVKIYFQDLRANGLPVHVEPYDTEFRLSKSAAVDLPKPLELSFVFAELDSLEPLRRLVSEDVLHLKGQLFIVVRLNTLEAAVMRARQVVLPLDMDQTIPMHAFADEPMIQSAVLRLLDVLSTPYSIGATALAKQHEERLSTARTLAAAAAGRVFLVYCGYSVRNPRTHDVQRYAQSGTAFLIDAEGTLLTAKRVVQPWKFDPQILSLISQSGYELDPKVYRLAAWPIDARVMTAKGELDLTEALTTDRHTLELWKLPADLMEPKTAASGANPAEMPSVHADGANDLALLKIVGQATTATPLASASDGETPSSAVLLGFPFGTDQERARLQQGNVTLEPPPGAGSPDLVRLARELNPGESGGPLVSADGKVIAVCAGSKTCVPMATALRSLEGATALSIPSASEGKKEVTVRFNAERRELLVLSLEEVNESLGAPKHDLPPDGVWQEVNPGGTFYTSDSARLKLLTSGGHLPVASTWYERASADSPWQVLGNGSEVAFNVAPKAGLLLIRVEVAEGDAHLSSAPVQYEIKQRLCPLLYKTTLDDIALGVATFREAKATTHTYKEAFAANGNMPQDIALLPDPDDPQKRPYQLADGDVVLRTGGPLGYVQRALGSPQSPQNHSGIIKTENYQGKSIYMVNEIGWGYEYTPLTPADADAYQQMKSLPKRPESFLEGANVGSLEVYRPVGMVRRSEGDTTSWQPYPIGQVAAARAVEIGAKAQLGYDFLFMESSPMADRPPFQNLYYCHEFTREAFGRKMTQPAPIPILQGLWKAGRACDQEMAAANATGTAGDPAGLKTVLSQIDVEHITFDPDPVKNEAARKEFRNLINSLQSFLGGEPLEQILKGKIAEQLQGGAISSLIGGLLKGNAQGAEVMQDLQRILSDTSLADLAKSSGLPAEQVALLGSMFHPALQAWVAAGRMGVAGFLTDDLYEDLGNAIDAKSLLAGGEAAGANGEPVRVTFKRISANAP